MMSQSGVAVSKLSQTVPLVSESMKHAVPVVWNIIPHLKTRFADVLKKSVQVLLVSLVLGDGLFFGSIHVIEKTLIRALKIRNKQIARQMLYL